MAQVNAYQLGVELLLHPIVPPAINLAQCGVEVLFHPIPPPQVNLVQSGVEVLMHYIPSSAYNVFNFTTMPSSPEPSSINVKLNAQTGSTPSDYTGQILTSSYETTYTEVEIFLPSIQDPTIQAAWLTFFATTVKQQAVFQIWSSVNAMIPAKYTTGWWRIVPGPLSLNFVPGGLEGGQLLENPRFTIRSLSKRDASYI